MSGVFSLRFATGAAAAIGLSVVIGCFTGPELNLWFELAETDPEAWGERMRHAALYPLALAAILTVVLLAWNWHDRDQHCGAKAGKHKRKRKPCGGRASCGCGGA